VVRTERQYHDAADRKFWSTRACGMFLGRAVEDYRSKRRAVPARLQYRRRDDPRPCRSPSAASRVPRRLRQRCDKPLDCGDLSHDTGQHGRLVAGVRSPLSSTLCCGLLRAGIFSFI